MRYKTFTTSAMISGIRVSVGGFNIAAGGSAAVVNFRNSIDNTGDIVLQVKIAASDSKAVTFERTLPFDKALYAEVVSGGPVVGTIWFE